MDNTTKPTIGIIGAGRLGTVLTRQALKKEYVVRIANSKGPESLQLILSVLMPKAIASTVEETITKSDLVILAIPLHQYKNLDPELFQGKIIIDAMNYWPSTEGYIEEFSGNTSSSSEFLQSYFHKATLIKTLNHVAHNELDEHSLPKGDPERRAIALAGDDTKAKKTVEQFIDDLGFDSIDAGELKEGRKFQPDTKLFNARYTQKEMEDELEKTK